MFMKKILGLLIISISFLACKQEFQGLEIYDFEGNIEDANIQINTTQVDFSKEEVVYFMGDFDDVTTVQITITGQSSGAVKTIDLNATNLNQDNTLWSGGSSSLIGFTKEQCDVRISFFGTDEEVNLSVEITGLTNFSNSNTIALGSNGFEQSSPSQNINKQFSEITDQIVTPQGDYSVKTDYDGQTYLYLGEDNLGEGAFYELPEDPSRVWFNIYVYGNGDPSSSFFVQFHEADGENQNFENGRDDGVLARVNLGHEGWQLFSFRYSDLKFSTFASGGGSGNKTHEPHKINLTSYNFEGVGESGTFYIDLPIYTIDAPFDPSNY